MNEIKKEPESECNSSQCEDQDELPQPFTFVAVKEEIVSSTSEGYVPIHMLCILLRIYIHKVSITLNNVMFWSYNE
jgi:hypothetical protein